MTLGKGRDLFDEGRYKDAGAEFEQALRQEPDNAQLHNWLGRVALAEKRTVDAEHAFRRARELGPTEPAYAYNLGLALERQTRDAEAEFRAALALKPDHRPARLELGRLLYERERYPEARAGFEEAISQDPDNAALHSWLGLVALAEKRAVDAEHAFRRARELGPTDSGYALNLALALEGQTRDADAEVEFRAALALKPDHRPVRLELGRFFSERERYPEARAQFEYLKAMFPNDAAVYSWLGRLGIAEKLYDAAEQDLRKAIALDQFDPWHYFNLGFLLDWLGRYSEGEEEYLRTVSVTVEYPSFSAAYSFHNVAESLTRRGEYRRAFDHWRKALTFYEEDADRARRHRDSSHFGHFGGAATSLGDSRIENIFLEGLVLEPDSTVCLQGLVGFYFTLADELSSSSTNDTSTATAAYWKARECYLKAERAIRKKPETCENVLELGLLLLNVEEYEAAASCFAKVLKRDPESAAACDGLGIALLKQEETRQAVEHFERAVRQRPENLMYRSNLGEAYAKLKRFEAAEREFNKILRVTTDHVESLVGLGEVYTAMAEAGDIEMFEPAVEYFNRSIRVGEAGLGSKKFKRSELAAAYYSRGYAKVKLYESPRTRTDETLLREAADDFRRARDLDARQHRAKRALERINRRLDRFTRERAAEVAGPILVSGGAVVVFLSALVALFVPALGIKISANQFATLTLGALLFMAAGLYLPQVLKFKVAGIELEKSAVEQVSAQTPFNIRR